MTAPSWLTAMAACAALSAGWPAAAQERIDESPALFGWSLSAAGVGVRVAPDYLGSDDYRLGPSGSLSLSRRGAEPRFSAPDDGVSLGLIGDRSWTAGLSGRWRSGRDNDGDLRGFEKVGGTVEAGAFATWWPAAWLRLRGEVRHGFGEHDSWVADVAADAVHRGDAWVLSVGPRLRWADDDFTRTYFTVTPRDAAQSPFGLRPYRPGGAFASAGLLASAERRLGQRWSVAADIDYRRLLGDATDSPIVMDLGSPDQFSASLGVRYAFGP